MSEPSAEYGATLRAALKTVKGIPGYGEMVDSDPSNWIRDLFFANDGRLTSEQLEASIGRMSFTYGHAIDEAWRHLRDEEYVEKSENGWIWPLALPAHIDRSETEK